MPINIHIFSISFMALKLLFQLQQYRKTLQIRKFNQLFIYFPISLMTTPKESIHFYDFSAQGNFQWSSQDFPQILQALQLKVDFIRSQNQEIVGTKEFEQYKNCKLLVHSGGKMEICNAPSIQIVSELFKLFVITLMQKLPESNILVATQLKATNYSAIVDLGFELKLKQVRKAINKLESLNKGKMKQLHLPFQIHKIEQVSVVLECDQVKIKKCKVIKDLDLFRAYLISILYPFRKTKPHDFRTQYAKYCEPKRKTSKRPISSWENNTQKFHIEIESQAPYFEEQMILKSQSFIPQ